MSEKPKKDIRLTIGGKPVPGEANVRLTPLCTKCGGAASVHEHANGSTQIVCESEDCGYVQVFQGHIEP